MSLFDDVTSLAVNRALDGTALQQQVIAQNIANSATPDYKAEGVSFESSLAAALDSGDPSSAPITITPENGPDQGNGNTVSLEQQSTDLVQSGLQYQALVQAMNYKLDVLHTAIGS